MTEPDDDGPVMVADKPRDPTEYEKQLRRQAATERAKRKDAEAALTAREATLKSEHEATLASERATATNRLKRAELKAAAIQAGMVDPEGLMLLDLSSVTLTDDGDLMVPDGFFENAKATKPFLFGSAMSTSSTHKAPSPNTETKLATEMTDAEYAAFKATMLRR